MATPTKIKVFLSFIRLFKLFLVYRWQRMVAINGILRYIEMIIIRAA